MDQIASVEFTKWGKIYATVKRTNVYHVLQVNPGLSMVNHLMCDIQEPAPSVKTKWFHLLQNTSRNVTVWRREITHFSSVLVVNVGQFDSWWMTWYITGPTLCLIYRTICREEGPVIPSVWHRALDKINPTCISPWIYWMTINLYAFEKYHPSPIQDSTVVTYHI